MAKKAPAKKAPPAKKTPPPADGAEARPRLELLDHLVHALRPRLLHLLLRPLPPALGEAAESVLAEERAAELQQVESWHEATIAQQDKALKQSVLQLVGQSVLPLLEKCCELAREAIDELWKARRDV